MVFFITISVFFFVTLDNQIVCGKGSGKLMQQAFVPSCHENSYSLTGDYDT